MTHFERWSVRIGTLLIAATGYALLYFQYGVQSTDPFAVVNHPWQVPALKGHVLAAPLFVLAIGFISVRHIWRHIVRDVQPGRKSGLLTVVSLVPMAVSGYLIQVVVSPGLHQAVIVTHIASSIVFTLGVGIHLVLMWRYLQRLRYETFCAQVRMKEILGLDPRDVRAEHAPDHRPETSDERNPAERDLAQAGRSAG